MPDTEGLARSKRRRSFATADLSDEKAEAIGASRMDERHTHLDAVLEPNSKRSLDGAERNPG